MSDICNSLQECQRTSEVAVSYHVNGEDHSCSRLRGKDCIQTHSNPPRKVWMNSNNDPLQDYIRRCFAAQGCSANHNGRERVVYSTLSTERNIPEIRRTSMQRLISNTRYDGTSRRPYVIIPSQLRYHAHASHPYLQPKRPKYVFINSNEINNRTEKKQYSAESRIPLSHKRIDNNCDRLDYLEKYILHNTNQRGYVTLNEFVLKELSIAISECLSKRINVIETKCKAVYEPISSAENSDCDEDEE